MAEEITKAPPSVIVATRAAFEQKYAADRKLNEPVREQALKVKEAQRLLDSAQKHLSRLEDEQTKLKAECGDISSFLEANGDGYWVRTFHERQQHLRNRGQ